MARRGEAEPRRPRETRLYDVEGRLTDDPTRAVRGEVFELDRRDRLTRTSRFRIEWMEFSWLPVSEPAFLLWVLVLFVIGWFVLAVILLHPF
jgi:hypothetical protein